MLALLIKTAAPDRVRTAGGCFFVFFASWTVRAFLTTMILLKNWRNFLDIEVALHQRVFLVGPNASGKSNYLDAFRFLSDIVTVGGGFQEAVLKRGGISRLRCLAARKENFDMH
jgi:hypothetical protein